jgi:hypothetical protein
LEFSRHKSNINNNLNDKWKTKKSNFNKYERVIQ